MLQPVIRCTWARQGQTPVLSSWDSRDRLSVIAGITISPVRWRLDLLFQVLDQQYAL